MALDLSKLNVFNKLDARSRVFVLLGGFIGVVFLIYMASKYFGGGASVTGPSRVAAAPQGLQSVPGGTQTQEFSKAVEQANIQRAQQAQISGSSAVPTLMNTQQGFGQPGGCVICTEQNINVKDTLDDWVKKGKITPEVAKALSDAAANNVSVNDYARMLDQMVKDGKLTPEQARILLDQYKKQHANAQLADSAKTMDDMIKSGVLPIDVANELLEAQKSGMSTSDYAAKLQQLVKEGKISPQVAAQLLAQYNQQRAKEITAESIAVLHNMQQAGQITPEVEKELVDLENRNVPLDTFSSTLDRLVSQGKITPAVAKSILDEYKQQKSAIGPTVAATKMLEEAEKAAYQELRDLVNGGKMTPEVAAQIKGLIDQHVSFDEFQSQINTLVQQNKLTPEIAKLKLADYQKVKGYRDLIAELGALQANNASAADVQEALKKAVQAGVITPDQAAELMAQYQAASEKPTLPAVTGPATEEFTKLQQRLQQGQAAPPTTVAPNEFAATQTQAQAETEEQRQERIQNLMSQMGSQAQELVASWQPSLMQHREGSPESKSKSGGEGAGGKGIVEKSTTTTSETSGKPVMIKAGTIIFAVLDTAVNSDYPDSPVMVTIVDGQYKGSKLLGKLTTTKGVSGQMDRVSLNFSLMNNDDWPKSKTVTAYAIDPDTARTVLASNVNYHYLQRFGAMMATSFLQGYAQAISQSASTTTTGIFGTSTTHPALSPSQKFMTGLGQVGQTLGAATQNYINIPPTVKVDSGVGLGILFMSDVS